MASRMSPVGPLRRRPFTLTGCSGTNSAVPEMSSNSVKAETFTVIEVSSKIVESGASSEDLEGIVDIPRQLAGIEVAVFLRELPDGKTKASLRSNGQVSVAAVARDLGGGGHEKAAGVLLSCGLDEAEQQVLALLRAAL